MDSSSSGSKKFFCLKPAKTGLQKSEQQNGNPSENGSNSFSLNNNPFLKCENEDAAEKTKTENLESKDLASDSKDIKTNNLFKPAKTNLFTNATTLKENSNFVFGQNLHERVVIDKSITSGEDDKKNEEEASNKEELLFSSALLQSSSSGSVASALPVPDDVATSEQLTQPIEIKLSDKDIDENSKVISLSSNDNNLSLVEAARRYEEMKGAQKRKYEEVEIITGEEDEKNILEINCKLFTFDKNNWEERGRGMLRLNDTKISSRVVFRASGSLRVLLNTKVWRDQSCQKPSAKSLRLTAFDTNGLLKIYLVMGRNEDIQNLYDALRLRIDRENDRSPELNERILNSEDEGEDQNSPEPVTKKLATDNE